MIPLFPEFKKLEISDKEDVNFFTSNFKPTSDFNFAGTWSWDVTDGMQISQLNSNYVIRFIDYSSREPFFTFLGVNNTTDTVMKILDFAKSEGIKEELKLIPDFCIENFDKNLFKIEEDRDNFDYIYSLQELKELKGGKFKAKRNENNTFLRKNPSACVSVLNLDDENTIKEIREIFYFWNKEKNKKNQDFDLSEELIVIERLISAHKKLNLKTLGVFVDKRLVSFVIFELLNFGYAIGHVAKSYPEFSGANIFLLNQCAFFFDNEGVLLLNLEQDLGEDSLRVSKMRLGPIDFIKKFRISRV